MDDNKSNILGNLAKSIYLTRKIWIALLIFSIVISITIPLTPMGQFFNGIVSNLPIVGFLLSLYDIFIVAHINNLNIENTVYLRIFLPHVASLFITIIVFLKTEEQNYWLNNDFLTSSELKTIKFIYSVMIYYMVALFVNCGILVISNKMLDVIEQFNKIMDSLY